MLKYSNTAILLDLKVNQHTGDDLFVGPKEAILSDNSGPSVRASFLSCENSYGRTRIVGQNCLFWSYKKIVPCVLINFEVQSNICIAPFKYFH